MKNIEQLIKESLENHELPYNEAAWESLSKRLDGTTPSPFYRKWWVAASVGTILVGSALFFTLNSQSESAKRAQKETPSVVQNTGNSQTTKQNHNAVSQHTAPQTNTLRTEKQKTVTNQGADATIAIIPNGSTHLSQNQKGEPVIWKDFENVQNSNSQAKSTPTDGGNRTNYVPATFNKLKYCVGEEIEITNPNENLAVQVVQNEKNLLTVKPGSKKTFTATSEGTIEVQAGNQKQTATVYGTTTDLYIHVDPSLIYENAIPAVRFTVSGNDNPVRWSVEKHASEVENGTFVVHPYKGTEIAVTVSSKDQNGCTVTEKKIISIPEEYKLNAAQALDIHSADPRFATFMPFALTKRNTPFELYIYDARSGRVLFKTSDASNGWNGVDSNTGELLKNGSTVLWKVILGNPNPGEPREYSGTLVLKAE